MGSACHSTAEKSNEDQERSYEHVIENRAKWTAYRSFWPISPKSRSKVTFKMHFYSRV